MSTAYLRLQQYGVIKTIKVFVATEHIEVRALEEQFSGLKHEASQRKTLEGKYLGTYYPK